MNHPIFWTDSHFLTLHLPQVLEARSSSILLKKKKEKS